MNPKTTLSTCMITGILVISCISQAQQDNPVVKTDRFFSRMIPHPHPDHPGNIFLADDSVTIKLPDDLPETVASWRLLDDQKQILKRGNVQSKISVLSIGNLPVGWYRVDFLDKDFNLLGHTTAAVLAALQATTPMDSPICVDSATAWFARNDPLHQEYLASLAALAGVNWVRDRLRWNEIQPTAERFTASSTTYDTAAEIQSRWGLQVLQVFHNTPEWATDKQLDPEGAGGRFPRDLRHLYNLCRHLASRFRGKIGAWEPWNEANVPTFGGHTIDEMCSFQKAAYLGFKAGDPEVLVGWNAYTTSPTQTHSDGLAYNRTLPYYDTYNIHSYDWPHSYHDLWPPARQATGGKPLWITESDRGMNYAGEEPWCEMTPEGEIQKAELIAQEYALSLFAGSSRHFHFILGHYYETNNRVQFGLLRLDHTPRPGYVALAAVGRLLASARCLGRLPVDSPANVYVFRAKPDGREKDVMVAWAEQPVDWNQRSQTSMALSLPDSITVQQSFDYLGRDLNGTVPARLSGKPIFLILEWGDADKLKLQKPPTVLPVKSDEPSPVVMQAQLPQKYVKSYSEIEWSHGYVYQMAAGNEVELPIWIYNFSKEPADGTIKVHDLPAGWHITHQRWDVKVEPFQREQITTKVIIDKDDKTATQGWLKFQGTFSAGNEASLALLIHSAQ